MDRRRILVTALCLLATPAPAQSPDAYHHPLGLFADMVADTLTEDIFNRYAPLPGLLLEATDLTPGRPLYLDCGAIACADLDGDGWTDVVLGAGKADGDPPSRLLWGRPDGLFDLAAEGTLPVLMQRLTRADVDGDGLTDLVAIVATGGTRHRRHDLYTDLHFPRFELTVLLNRGDRTFDVRPLGLQVICFTLFDFDHDGWLDIAAVEPNFSRHERAGERLVILRGGPDGFVPARAVALPETPYHEPELLALILAPHGPRQIVLHSTSILDPWPGSYVLDDPLGRPSWRPLDLIPGGTTASLAIADANRDGNLELFIGVTDYAGGRNRLLALDPAASKSNPRWRDLGRQAGLWGGYNYTEGAAWGDLDNDGLDDLWQSRGHAMGQGTESQLYWNRGDLEFVNATAALSRPAALRTLRAVWLDTDRDGRLDLLVGMSTAYTDLIPLEDCRPVLYRNRSEAGNWLQLELGGRAPNTDAIGATVTAWTGGRPMWRQLDDGTSSGGSSPPLTLHFGLGEYTAADSVVVRWPDGRRQTWLQLAAGRRHVLTEQEHGPTSGQ